MADKRHDINMVIRRVCGFFTASLLLASVLAAIYTGETFGQVIDEWFTIMGSPSPLVTDYFRIGSLPAALLNAGICGLACTIMTLFAGAIYRPNVWAGFFLVIAHCFYGLNFLNMWPPIIGFYIYCKHHNLRVRDNLDWAMFITSFAPFFSELLFRYPFAFKGKVTIMGFSVDFFPVIMCMLLSVFVSYTLPAMMPGAGKLHRGFNLYNGGLATGLLGLLIYSFMYKTMGVSPEGPLAVFNKYYVDSGESYTMFAIFFFGFMGFMLICVGWYLNGMSFHGYGFLLEESGHKANFLRDYGEALTIMNLGFYMLMMLAYFVLVTTFTDGAGFTGPTFGVLLAAMTFSASGQHPKNVWPILLGYMLLSAFVHLECGFAGRSIPWTLSTQGYMNGVAFATGLCPFAGKYGWKIGALAGALCAVMCTTTSTMHGGFVLYNGGLTAGITAIILVALIDTYISHSEKYGRGLGK